MVTDCKWKWEPWGKCSARCGGGMKNRRVRILESEHNGGVCEHARGAEAGAYTR